MRSTITGRGVSWVLLLALAAIGVTSVTAQVVLLRELLIASYGNELCLGLTLSIWLLWTAAGSSVLGRLSARGRTTRRLALLQLAAPFALLGSVLLARDSRSWWNALPGETPGPVAMAVVALIVLALFCPLSGWLFSTGARACAEAAGNTIAEGSSATYFLEAVGSTAGGVLASTFLVRFVTTLQIIAFLTLFGICIATWLLTQGRGLRLAITTAAVAACAISLSWARHWEIAAVARGWPGFQVVDSSTSPYGALAVIEADGNRSLVQNGIVLFTVPDPAAAEETVHMALLEHAAPRRVLLVGGGVNGTISEILRYRTIERVDYVELDSAVLRLARDDFPQAWRAFADDARVRVHNLDGRHFIKTARQQFDVVVINVHDPETAQLNRFYTEEFFREVRALLSPRGVLALQLRGAEEYLSPELIDLLSCIRATLAQVFADVVALPGETTHFFASPSKGVLTSDAKTLVARLRERGLRTTYISEHFLPFRLAPERVRGLEDRLRDNLRVPLNRDFSPAAYYLNVARWAMQFSPRFGTQLRDAAGLPLLVVASALLVPVIIATVACSRRRTPHRRAAATASLAVTITGLTLMATEILLLLGFQVIYGYVFSELALIVAGFMSGIAAGSWTALRRRLSPGMSTSDLRHLLGVQAGVALSPAIVTVVLFWLAPASIPPFVVHLVFAALAVGCGVGGGYQFPIAMRLSQVSRASAGFLYGLDLAGSAVGAFLVSVYLLPIFGFSGSALLLLLVNLGPLAAATVALARAPTVAHAAAACADQRSTAR